MKKISKCEKINVLKQKLVNLERISDSISKKQYRAHLKDLKRELLALILSKEHCKQGNDDMNNFYVNLSNFKDRMN